MVRRFYIKRIISIILASLLLASFLAACGKTKLKETEKAETNAVETNTPETDSPVPAYAPDSLSDRSDGLFLVRLRKRQRTFFEKMSPKTPQKLLCSVVGFADFEKILLFLKKTMEIERGMCYNIKNVMWGSRALS